MATEKRLIDAHALLMSEVKRCGSIPTIGTGYMNETGFKQILDQAPTVDAVEVVRCKDCKYCDPENHHCDHYTATILPLPRKPDGFCSYGERKDNEVQT